MTGIMLGFLAIGMYILLPTQGISCIIMMILGFILLTEWPKFHQSILTPLYPTVPFIMLVLLNETKPHWLFPLTIVMVVAHDTGAYCIGKLIGTHKLCPFISPGKTWEGMVGGIMFSCIVTIAIVTYFDIPVAIPRLIPLILIINSAAVAGDLFESYLKREAHIKDAGYILPGHGGLLDRLDSLLFAATIMYIIHSIFI